MRVDGPRLRTLDRLGDAFATEVTRQLRATLGVTAAELRARPSPDDLAQLRRHWDARVARVLTPAVAAAYWYGVNVVQLGLARGLEDLTAAVDDRPDEALDVEVNGPDAPAWFPRTAGDVPRVPTHRAELQLTAAVNRLVGIGDVAWESARTQLLTGLQAGEDLRQLRTRVVGALDVAQPRADVVARTEVNAAANLGALDEFRETGLAGTKEWIATDDTRTRAAHRAADGQEVDVGAKFDVGGEPLDGPHDFAATPGNTVNCRCTIGFDVADDALQALVAAGDGPGDARRLKEYWVHGEGAAKIRWGQPGDFKRCVRHLRPHVRDPEGLCNTYHVAALGVPPGKEKTAGEVEVLVGDDHYDPTQPRDTHGRWSETPGSRHAPTVKNVKPGARAVPAHVWHKNADGTVVGESSDGTHRMYWDDGKRRYVVEQRQGDGWRATGEELGKQAAYDRLKAGGWVQPHEKHAHPATSAGAQVPTTPVSDLPRVDRVETDVKPATPPLPPNPPDSLHDLQPRSRANPGFATRDHPDGTVIARNAATGQRMRWDAEQDAYVLDRRRGASWETTGTRLSKDAARALLVKFAHEWSQPDRADVHVARPEASTRPTTSAPARPVTRPPASPPRTRADTPGNLTPTRLGDPKTTRAQARATVRKTGMTGDQYKRTVDGLTHDLGLMPSAAESLYGVTKSAPKSDKHQGEYVFGRIYVADHRYDDQDDSAAHRPNTQGVAWHSHVDPDVDPLHSTLSHEFGHHVDSRLSADARGEVLDLLAKQLGVPPPTGKSTFVNVMFTLKGPHEDWVRANRVAIERHVSRYGATNSGELLAEIWREYSRGGKSTRTHIHELGKLMQRLSERPDAANPMETG